MAAHILASTHIFYLSHFLSFSTHAAAAAATNTDGTIDYCCTV